MAFPTSPSNNQVHKEGNRSFVYDSALGVWDQVRETDRTDNKVHYSTEGGPNSSLLELERNLEHVKHPAGQILQVVVTKDDYAFSYTNGTQNTFGTQTTRANDQHGGVAKNLNTHLITKGTNSSFLCRTNFMHLCAGATAYNVYFRPYWSVDNYNAHIPASVGSQSNGNYSSGQVVQAGFWQGDVGDESHPPVTSEYLTTSSLAKGVSVTFKIVIGCSYTSTGNTLRYNHIYQTNNAHYRLNPISTHTVIEIAT